MAVRVNPQRLKIGLFAVRVALSRLKILGRTGKDLTQRTKCVEALTAFLDHPDNGMTNEASDQVLEHEEDA